MIEDLREFLSDWTLAIASVLGLIVAWNNAKTTITRWFRRLNLYARVSRVEEDVEELQNISHTHPPEVEEVI